MTDYTIYCTPEQTKKALGLGAPIFHTFPNITMKGEGWFQYKRYSYLCPTAEQMLGWLEEKTVINKINVTKGSDDKYHWGVFLSHQIINGSFDGCKTRKEATLAAIDVALEYLSNSRK